MTFKSIVACVSAFATLSFATPATAAPIEQLGCIAEKVGSVRISQIGSDFADELIQTANGDSRSKLKESDFSAMQQAALACKEFHGWTNDEMRNAAMATIFGAAIPVLAAQIAANGVDIKMLDDHIDSYTNPAKYSPSLQFDFPINVSGVDPKNRPLVALIKAYSVAKYAARLAMDDFANERTWRMN